MIYTKPGLWTSVLQGGGCARGSHASGACTQGVGGGNACHHGPGGL